VGSRSKKNRKKTSTTKSPRPQSTDVAQSHGAAKPLPVGRRARRRQYRNALILVAAFIGLLAAGRVSVEVAQRLKRTEPAAGEAESAFTSFADADLPAFDEPVLTLAEIQAQRRIINVHEHIQSLEYAPIYLDIMDELGIQKICLMGSSMFTLTLNESYGFTGYDENNEELLKIVEAYPGRFEAWPVADPLEERKLEKFKDYVARGATGLKLYTGHGYVTKDREFIFHPIAMDDPRMFRLYEFCEENYIPVCIHVNPFDDGTHKGKPGFAQELIAVLSRFPDMKVDVPHFMLSSIKSTRLCEYLDTFPNVYTDISFGDYFMAAGLKRISQNPPKYRNLFADYPDRIMYATDLVLTAGRRKTHDWVREQFQAYLDMLSKAAYTTPAIPDTQLRGLELPDEVLNRVLFKNYEEFVAKRPKNTKITRTIDWKRMGVTPIARKPGQAFPPRAK